MLFFFFFKQKTAYEMRISDWSSACALPISLRHLGEGAGFVQPRQQRELAVGGMADPVDPALEDLARIGVDMHRRALPGGEPADLGLTDVRLDPDRRRVVHRHQPLALVDALAGGDEGAADDAVTRADDGVLLELDAQSLAPGGQFGQRRLQAVA